MLNSSALRACTGESDLVGGTREFDIDITNTDVHTIVLDLAERQSYSPVVEYLDECEAKFPQIDAEAGWNFLDGLAKANFATDDLIHNIYFKKLLVSAVARARQPGCQVDSVFILVSPRLSFASTGNIQIKIFPCPFWG